jgi:hypothetical protein
MVYFFARSIELGERQVMVGIDSTEAAEQAHVAIELYAIGALNLLASIGLESGRRVSNSAWGNSSASHLTPVLGYDRRTA